MALGSKIILPLANIPSIHLDQATDELAQQYGYKTFVHFELMTRCDVLKTTSPYGSMARVVHGGLA